ncbi:hypothetical protein EDC01DRAFT_517672 [Geopyxis carbonaria]|nr:hypothetical protein EDC01DRAFT_517672 [Geopyxis carbonaria]
MPPHIPAPPTPPSAAPPQLPPGFTELPNYLHLPTLPPSVISHYASLTPPLLRSKPHPTLPLHITNYTFTTTSKHTWNAATLACRSLITHATTGAVVARSFPKFFNHDDRDAYKPTGAEARVVVEEKIDGSIALLWWYAGAWRWASRGSFDGPHVALFRGLWETAGGEERERGLVQGLTYVFEAIDPGNVIGVRYGERRELVLLAVFAP